MPDSLPRSDDLEATWNFIAPAIGQILGHDQDVHIPKRVDKVLSSTMYMEVYTAVYNYCVNKSRSSGQFVTDKQPNQSSILVGSEIYGKLKAYLKEYLLHFHKRDSETFLQFYVRRWKRFTIGAIFLNHTFDYMNRYWVQKERSDGKRDIFDVNTLCLMTWKEVMFDANSSTLIKEILDQITLERDGNMIQRSNVTTAIKTFVALGIDPQDLKKLNLNVYITNFEKPLLEKTTDYYTQYSNDYLETHSVTEYISQAHEIVSREEEGMAMYWDDHTKKPLSETLTTVLVSNHSQKLKDEFIVLLDSRDQANISALYTLMQRDFSLLPELANTYEEYVKKSGQDEISQLIISNKVANQNSKNVMLPPKDYVKKLIEVYHTFGTITHECFLSDPLFTKALDNACRAYVNNNEFAMPMDSSRNATSKTPEMLARYSDQLLKKSTKPEISNDMSIDDIMMMFKFLTDKDAFESHYRRLFAKRLIHGTSTSDADEEAVMQRLQSENSMEYAGKIAKMFQDVRLSKILEEDFNTMIKGLPDYSRAKYPELQPFVLAETMWPFSYQPISFNLPKDLQPSFEKLQSTYTAKHNGRLLKWLLPLCRGELKANIGKPGRPPFLFTVTLFQMAILLLYNMDDSNPDDDTLTLEQIQEKTNLSVHHIASSMIPFIKYKLIQQIPPGLDALVKPETKFKLAKPYKAVKTKINFASGVKSDVLNALVNSTSGRNHDDGNNGELTESEKVEKEVNTERQIFLEACIVRIMKAKRQLPHTTLVNECISQSHQRFSPRISQIKKAIDSLIQKEYLQRGEDGESYEYLA